MGQNTHAKLHWKIGLIFSMYTVKFQSLPIFANSNYAIYCNRVHRPRRRSPSISDHTVKPPK